MGRSLTNFKMSTPLLNTDDLQSLLIFEKLCDDWVREVHKFNSQRKKKKNFVIFRNCENKKVSSLEELREELADTSFLETANFKSAFSHDIVSNKVGANKIARKAAKEWMAESAGRKLGSKPKVKKEEVKVPATKEGFKKKIEVKPKKEEKVVKEEPKIARVPEILSEVATIADPLPKEEKVIDEPTPSVTVAKEIIAVQEDVEETKSVIKEEEVKETVVEDALPEDEPIVEEISTEKTLTEEVIPTKAEEKEESLDVKQEKVEDILPVKDNIISTEIEPETEEVKTDIKLIEEEHVEEQAEDNIVEGEDKPEMTEDTMPVEEVLATQIDVQA